MVDDMETMALREDLVLAWDEITKLESDLKTAVDIAGEWNHDKHVLQDLINEIKQIVDEADSTAFEENALANNWYERLVAKVSNAARPIMEYHCPTGLPDCNVCKDESHPWICLPHLKKRFADALAYAKSLEKQLTEYENHVRNHID